MKKIYLSMMILILAMSGCGSGGGGDDGAESPSEKPYIVHENITATIFWIGEKGGEDNGGIPNLDSVWDDMWLEHYGGVDDPDDREGYRPASFVPLENPFYAALPYNDFDEDGKKKSGIEKYIPWVDGSESPYESVCKNRWIEVVYGDRKVYVQWEDAGPFGENDIDYVFSDAEPANGINDSAGIDLSPAARDYLGMGDMAKVSWRFVDEKDVPEGPWREIVTRRGVSWGGVYRPSPGVEWQWQLQGDINESYDVELYDIDLFDTDRNLIDRLHERGIKVICYFSAGSWEEWREDSASFPDSVKGNELDGWPGERWLDIRDTRVRDIMKKRFDMALSKGCDGVEPDNVDGYSNDTGFDLDAEDQLDYNIFLSREAHARGLSIGLKNDLEQIAELEPYFDFALNEQCHRYAECDMLTPFIEADKAVLNAEYARRYVDDENARHKLCRDSNRRGFSTLVLPVMLDDSFRYSCLQE
jgi:hypothetical protein